MPLSKDAYRARAAMRKLIAQNEEKLSFRKMRKGEAKRLKLSLPVALRKFMSDLYDAHLGEDKLTKHYPPPDWWTGKPLKASIYVKRKKSGRRYAYRLTPEGLAVARKVRPTRRESFLLTLALYEGASGFGLI